MSPSLPFYGAYFPFWLLCAVAGIFCSILLRIILVKLKVDEGIPFRAVVYIAFGCATSFILATAVFGV
ncbi:hypothetical protein K08M3_18470 [Vibrio alginolyticus]|uniref:Uncharacterized protein YtcA n=1 Tax=Vibrio alginolyticus TaxID=663 RepID=A0A1W6TS96_VIBAL|nr:hypothetical protein K01M1_18440 [Vibrio alginolyticus]ARP03502.1 hypothetical protein K04M1_18560 [Vibrio alginolyticus]ARP08560.1 hypothetical protein K04M3_18590 [Vibrio alginolyticus]ARP13635.1 hypothetical protein K04M5_18470 [Vibrio alginolyticus]ARP18695.1 hypothetical protein K05K4_18610 [Vibrio alginolyticus]